MTTAQAQTQIVITADPTASGAQAYHRDFPEIRSRGRTPSELPPSKMPVIDDQLPMPMTPTLSPWTSKIAYGRATSRRLRRVGLRGSSKM